ncbi:MAG: hypothetical protein K5872_11985 [Rhizobiaceae bacterium]|nr:hypothetical protein [Rhizobiaceae bacterium]MCV0406935.1 hypothetical protein [Rhizobiaceae bacterium]
MRSRIGIWRHRLLAVCLIAPLTPAPFAQAEAWRAPDSPFTLGEAYPDVPATCETVGDWIDHAPTIDGRISFAIVGELVAAEWDGTLAYLVMCPEGSVQVMCVTYSKDGRAVGDRVLFGGGWSRIDHDKIMLDPCLASPEE